MVYDTEKKLSHISYYSSYVIPKLQETLILCLRTKNEDSVKHIYRTTEK